MQIRDPCAAGQCSIGAMPGYVDAHHQVIAFAPGDYGDVPSSASSRDYRLADSAPMREQANVTSVVLVQAAPTAAETQHLLDVANGSDGAVQGVVGFVDLAAPDAIPALTRLARNPLLKAVRPAPQAFTDADYLRRPDVGRTLAALPRLSLRLEACVRSAHLPQLRELVERHPALAVVIDHAGLPDIAGGEWTTWTQGMAALAAQARVRCKLSGLVTQAGPGWTIDVLRRYVDFLAERFGATRLMWGSDWPRLDVAATYASWYAATVALTATWSSDDRTALMGNTARRFYGL